MVMKINGVDILPYIANQGLKWQRGDIDGPNAGRLMTGDMVRDRIAIKIRWDVTCRAVTGEELAMLLSLIEPEFVTVKYTDPTTNSVKTDEFYSNNFPVQFCFMHKDGKEYWTGLSFPLIMK